VLPKATDIKPNNILLNYEQTDGTFSIKRVQISDLEDVVVLPPGKYWREACAVTRCGGALSPGPEQPKVLHQTSSPLELWYVCQPLGLHLHL
jgi:hypothetical protein